MVWDRFWEAELDTSQPCSVPALCPSLPPMQDQVLLTPPPRYPPWLPAGAPPSPITTVTPQKLRCARKVRDMPLPPCPGALHPTPSAGSSSMSQEVPPTLICQGGISWIPVGILMRVSSLAGVPGAIPGGGVPGAGFFPGKGVQAVLGGASPCLQGWGRCLGGPRLPLSQHGGLGTCHLGSGDMGTPCLAAQPWVAAPAPPPWGQDWVAVPCLH